MSDAFEIPVGPLTFDAWVDGPADGRPTLLLHGFPESAWCWRHVQPALAAGGRRVVAFDQRGYSPRARPSEVDAYRMTELVGDVLAVADHLGWERFDLVGHDWGGAVAWHVAGRHPERVRKLAVVSTPHPFALGAARKAGPQADGEDQLAKSSYMDFFRSPEATEAILADDKALFRMMLAGAGLGEESVAHYVEWVDGPAAVDGALNWYRAGDPTDADGLGPITAPTLYVWSTEDVALGRLAAETTGDHVEGPYRFEVLEGIDHWIPESAPDALIALLDDHLT